MSEAEPIFLTPNAGRVLQTQVERVVKASGRETAGRLSLAVVPSRAGFGPPLHRHLRNDEAFFVLDGEYEFLIGDAMHIAGSGAFLYVPMGVPHAFRGLVEGGRLLEMFVPADFEGYFEELARLRADRAWTPEAVSALQATYGMEVLGPPLGESDG